MPKEDAARKGLGVNSGHGRDRGPSKVGIKALTERQSSSLPPAADTQSSRATGAGLAGTDAAAPASERPLWFPRWEGARADPPRDCRLLRTFHCSILEIPIPRTPQTVGQDLPVPHLGAQGREVRYYLLFLLPVMKPEKPFAPL